VRCLGIEETDPLGDNYTLIGLRDRALLGLMGYTFARVSAVITLRVEDYFSAGPALVAETPRKGRQAAHGYMLHLRRSGLAGAGDELRGAEQFAAACEILRRSTPPEFIDIAKNWGIGPQRRQLLE